jgi:hypothetical protein
MLPRSAEPPLAGLLSGCAALATAADGPARDYAAPSPRRDQMQNITLQPAFLKSLMTAGANLELQYADLAPHASDRLAAALDLAKHAKEKQRQLKFIAISAGTSGIKHLAEEGDGYVTFALVA